LKVSAPVEVVEEVVIGGGILLLLGVNYALLRPAFKPLERLAEGMKNVDLPRPGRRLVPRGSPEIVDLVRAFNDMLDRLETERRESSGRALAAQEAENRRELFAEAQEATRRSVEEVRRIAQELRPELLEHLGS
jgi:two-component system sensor histidine kinase UhpB